MIETLVIGAGPAGLMAASELAQAGHTVTIADAKPSFGRKFLMAGKSGLNLTKSEEFEMFLSRFGGSETNLNDILKAFDPEAVQQWSRDLGQEVFTGTSGRVFPKTMKASPLLRAWLIQLQNQGVTFQTRWRWTSWEGDTFIFETPDGPTSVTPKRTVLALGGASWSRLGSDGAWSSLFTKRGIPLAPFAPANVGLRVDWSPHMEKHFGTPVKSVALIADTLTSRGEFIVSAKGLEGGGIYTMSPATRMNADLSLDLLPDWSLERIAKKLRQKSHKTTLTNHLRKSLHLDPIKIALLMEFGRPLPTGDALAAVIKALAIKYTGTAPIDEAISTAGGVAWSALNASLMLEKAPGTFIAGEMLDWEAPTGGYLINACLATGKWAGQHAANYP
ncbi:MAG: TIGR03862 family flavoprotein [Paracoccaceae bacterium]